MRDTMTEPEARKKWCPLTRVGNEAGCNRSHNDFGSTAFCIGSACMAWRFDEAAFEHGDCLPLGSAPADPGWEQDGETWYAGPGVTGEKRMRWKRALPRTGYCNAFERVRSW